ncbi:MAG: diguanylate cyclase (GGDEF)-like protein [Sulfurimonas sp.]|jgi:diguanylate cyclase (GGDEF)-like protein|uniref:diguanylate cyclase n=1 Tax=Sulfurimonas sp. TaxID=2022749 RepID=UPI0039E38D4E
MNADFNYRVLLISDTKEIISGCKEISETVDLKLSQESTFMDALEHLMDYKANIIVLDLSIGQPNALEFLDHISSDYENKFAPIIMLSDIKEIENLSSEFLNFNIISTMCKQNWQHQASRLLNYLSITQLNLHVMQDSLIQSEGRGTMDQLTGAYNRYGCEDVFHSLTSRVKAYSEPFSIIMVDIDHFKSVNDTYGHDIGDDVLVSFSDIIMGSIRRDDSLIRLGGEEFIIFLSNATSKIAINRAERIRIKVEDASHSAKNLKITASFGVVEYEGEEMDTMIKKSDELLYIAKNSGRNMVVSKQSNGE